MMQGMFVVAAMYLLVASSSEEGLTRVTNDQGAERANAQAVESEVPGLSTARKSELDLGEEGARGEAPFRQLTVDAATVLEHFELLKDLAISKGGPCVINRMALGICESAPSMVKQQAIEKFLAFADDLMKKGSPAISGNEVVRAVGSSLVGVQGVTPSYGVQEAKDFFLRHLKTGDYRVRAEAARQLFVMASVVRDQSETILQVLEAQYEKENMAQDYPAEGMPEDARKQAALEDLASLIERLKSAAGSDMSWRLASWSPISDNEYAALKALDREGQFRVAAGGGIPQHYALKFLLENGCSDETMDRLLEIARGKSGPEVSTVIDGMEYGLTRPFKDNVATEENQRQLDRFMRIMLEEVRSQDEGMRMAALKVAVRQLKFWSTPVPDKTVDSGGGTQFGDKCEPAIDILLAALDSDYYVLRTAATRELARVAIGDLERAKGIIAVLSTLRERVSSSTAVLEPRFNQMDDPEQVKRNHDMELSDIDRLIKQMEQLLQHDQQAEVDLKIRDRKHGEKGGKGSW